MAKVKAFELSFSLHRYTESTTALIEGTLGTAPIIMEYIFFSAVR